MVVVDRGAGTAWITPGVQPIRAAAIAGGGAVGRPVGGRDAGRRDAGGRRRRSRVRCQAASYLRAGPSSRPPSMTNSEPVAKDASSELMNSRARVMSSGWPSRGMAKGAGE
ncbi:hypothetical protein Ga0074812_12171 [Parafrankia irregularis]|uniref:Uncharacterized protein n=1 Tax=Parafrankia irregularis TaxID=795642 RepID=A0A0S4QSU5_9ACTN|nr:hypothetical protein Ga0074812_12171 [Parafrankia irregularis]